ncbi:unnamed protein product [Caenorhabditis auriculariae]|uniref:Uncharacterized protein n=1 Tax=Caenorhabditis auriculariae TaxID=2777116 RepID=A0A8S1H997_9PELO|nr:unnamed protein product [Caenorhabditis auriculariae]
MSKLSEEDRIREVLRELKSRGDVEDVHDDIERIESILRNPLFNHFTNKVVLNALLIKSLDAFLMSHGSTR